MIRIAIAAFGLSLLSTGPLVAADEVDPIRTKLDQARLVYDSENAKYLKAIQEYFDKLERDARQDDKQAALNAELAKYQKAVLEYFAKREDDARQDGNKKLVDQIKDERKSFEEKGELPKVLPMTLRQMHTMIRFALELANTRKKMVDQIKAERKLFEEKGELPKFLPAAVKKIQTDARTSMEAAYELAVREYTKIKKDDEATKIEKLLAEFKRGDLPISYAVRSGAIKERVLQQNGGNADTERAVERGLAWLARQQNAQGYWEFDGGMKADRIAATGMCLLPYLAAGETHLGGKYKDKVAKGLAYLRSQLKPTGQFGAAGMYTQPIATIALCEAAGMTQDKVMVTAAQAAVNFVVRAQAGNGSWGYTANTEGDTSIVGWNIQALKSARLAGLTVPDKAFKSAGTFLDTTASDAGATYGYRAPGATHTLTAVGLLSRQYMGWSEENAALKRGVAWFVEKSSPSKTDFNMYYYYYATQVLQYCDGPLWQEKWNPALRKMLLELQIT